MDDKYKELESKIDHLQECMYTLMHYIEERDKNDFERDVEANLLADLIFEQIFSPETFFDKT